MRSTFQHSRDGTKLAVFEAGEGRPIVLFHGLSGTHDIWEQQTAALSERFKVIAVDTRGHGDSAPGAEGYSPHLYAEDVEAVLTGMDLRDAIVVGHSLGGTAVGQFCVDHPDVVRDRVAGFVFVGTFASAFNGEGWFRERFGRRLVRLTAPMSARRKPDRKPGRAAFRMARYGFGDSPRRADIERLIEIGSRTPPAVVGACTLGNLDYDVRDRLHTVTVPALVIVGEKDRLARLRSARRLSDGIQGAQLVVMPGVGHMVMFERPSEITELIEGFAARC